MKKNAPFLKWTGCIALATVFSLHACKKKEDAMDPDPDLTTEQDVSNADSDLNSIISDIDKVAGQISAREDGAATFIFTGPTDTAVGTFNEYVHITYTGDGDDGLSRSGSMIVYFKKGHSRALGNYEDSAIFSATKVDGRAIQGFKWTKQVTADDTHSWKFQIMASGQIANSAGVWMDYTTSRTRVRAFKNGSSPSLQDTWSISGSWDGTNSKGQSVTATITSPIVIDGTCSFRLPVSGSIDFTNNALNITRSIAYGNGDCDHWAVFTTAKGKQYLIYLR